MSRSASAFIRAPTSVLSIPTCFLSITLPAQQRASYMLGGRRRGALCGKHPARGMVSREMTIEGGYTESTAQGRNPNRSCMAHGVEWLTPAGLGQGGGV